MKNKLVYFIILFFTISPFLFAKDTHIIVHGTWASGYPIVSIMRKMLKNSMFAKIAERFPEQFKKRWYEAGGDFYEAYSKEIKEKDSEAEILVFYWPGKNNYPSRRQAAVKLAKLIKEKEPVSVIGHSYGAHVAYEASQILAKNRGGDERYKIKTLCSLGAPVNENKCSPNMDIVGKHISFSSNGDPIQSLLSDPVKTTFARCPERTSNVLVSFGEKNPEPGHSELRDPRMAKALIKLLDRKTPLEHLAQAVIDDDGNISCCKDHDTPNNLARNKRLFEQIRDMD